jgi:peptidoglycan/LPS O-acetylase OafA/YrhL
MGTFPGVCGDHRRRNTVSIATVQGRYNQIPLILMRIASLDAVRGAAAFSVAIPHFFMAQHCFVEVAEGISIVAVEVFFVLSGFVLAPQLIFCFHRPTYRNFGTFFVRRWVRTIPPFIFALVLISGLYGELFSGDFFNYLFFTRNLFSFSDANDYFFTAWSLAVEEWFYIIFPIVLWLKFKNSPAWVGCIFVVSLLAVKILLALFHPEAVAHVRRVAVLRLDAIAFGFLLYVAIGEQDTKFISSIKGISIYCIVILGLAIGGLLVLIKVQPSLWKEIAFTYLAPLFGCSVIALAHAYRDGVFAAKHFSWIALSAGKISYTIYLFHISFILVIEWNIHASMILQFCVYLITLVAFCVLFFRFVESPLLASRPRYARDEEARALA